MFSLRAVSVKRWSAACLVLPALLGATIYKGTTVHTGHTTTTVIGVHTRNRGEVPSSRASRITGRRAATAMTAPFTLTTQLPSNLTGVASNVRLVVGYIATNVSSSNTAFGVSVACTGTLTNCQAPYSLGIAIGQADTIQVGFHTGAASTTGTMTLTVWVGTDTLHATYTITTNAVTGVTVTPLLPNVTPAANASTAAGFSVKNTGSASTTYTLSVACPGGSAGAVASCTTPAPVTIPAGSTSTVNVSYTATGTVNNTSPLMLTATSADVNATGTTTVTVGAGGMAVDVVSPNNGTAVPLDQCLTVAAGKDGAYECGNLRLTHTLPTVTTRGKARTPILLYNSQWASPYPLVGANVTLPTVPTTVTATLTINGATRATGSWTGSNWTTNSTRRITVGYDASTDATGAYPYALTVASTTGGTTTTDTVRGTIIVVNRHASPFGAGWWLAGLEQVIPLTSGEVLWIAGDGSARVYHVVTANSVWAADPVDRPDTLKLSGSTYTRYAEHGLRVLFNATGQHIATINRLNDTTQFGYTGTSLTSIIVPSGGTAISYSLVYGNTGGVLSTVSSLGRTTIVTLGTLGRIASIADPDTRTVQYAYIGSTNRIQKRTDRNGHVTWYDYNTAGRLIVDSMPVASPATTIITRFTPQESQGFTGSVALPLTSVYTQIDDPRTDVADTTVFVLNRYGAPTTIVDALGDSTILQRTNVTYPGLVTSIRRPNGFTTIAAYDVRGNITQSTDLDPLGETVNATTQYAWDPRWDFTTKIKRPVGDSVVMAYDSINGNQLWQQDGRGTTGRVTFSYYPTGSGADTWLLHAVQQPSGRTDSLFYNNGFRNLSSTKSPAGIVVYHYYDSYGRDTLTKSPTDAAQTVFVEDTTRYDLMDRVTRTATRGGTQVAVTTRTYDYEGNVTQVQRSASDDPTLGVLTTQSRYDAADRLVAAVAVGGVNVDSTVYNPAGQVVKTISRLKDTVTMTYDVLGRLTRRVSNSKLVFITTESNGGKYPRYANESPLFHNIKADTATFTYDVVGNMTKAANIGAVILRTYYPNGLMATDTQEVRTYTSSPTAWGNATTHQYGLGFLYDLDGRRQSMYHSFNLAGDFTARMQYVYDVPTGWLTTIRDLHNDNFSFTYDVDGRPIRTSFPGNIHDSTVYNADDAITRHTVFNTTTTGNGYWPGAILTDEVMTRDVRGKLTSVIIAGMTPIDTSTETYSTLGALTASTRHQPYVGTYGPGVHNETEGFTLDALANLQATTSTVYDAQPGSSTTTTFNAGYTYQPAVSGQGTGRLQSRGISGSTAGTETYTYDSAGNQVRVASSATPASISRSYYDALGKLVLVDQRSGSSPDSLWHYDEYVYDALGRVVLVRSRPYCSAVYNPGAYYPGGGGLYYVYDGRCEPTIKRTVWDGNQVLWEVQYNGMNGTTAPSEQDQGWDFTESEITGKVNYVNGADLDKPLGVLRFDYRSGTNYQVSGPTLIVPHYNWRGAPVFPTFATGQVEDCATWGTSPPNCVAVSWPSMQQSYEKMTQMEVSWHGGFVDQQTQGSGLQYKRNRFYDPNTGQFTQEDPIGLAGGFNAYGFVAGDPINYSDPLGLCPPGMTVQECIEYIAKAGDLRDLVSAKAHEVQEGLAAAGRSWSAQRQAFWKEVSKMPDVAEKWAKENIDRMRTGRAPRLPNKAGESQSAELSHEPVPQREGGTQVVPRTPDQHASVDYFRRLGGDPASDMDTPVADDPFVDIFP